MSKQWNIEVKRTKYWGTLYYKRFRYELGDVESTFKLFFEEPLNQSVDFFWYKLYFKAKEYSLDRPPKTTGYIRVLYYKICKIKEASWPNWAHGWSISKQIAADQY